MALATHQGHQQYKQNRISRFESERRLTVQTPKQHMCLHVWLSTDDSMLQPTTNGAAQRDAPAIVTRGDGRRERLLDIDHLVMSSGGGVIFMLPRPYLLPALLVGPWAAFAIEPRQYSCGNATTWAAATSWMRRIGSRLKASGSCR